MRLLIGFTIILFMVAFLSDAFAQFDTGTTTKTDILESNENDEIEVRTDFESSTTGAWKLPSGTEAQRPDPAESGMIRYNSEEDTFEGFVVDLWGPIAGSGGLSTFEASFDYDAGDYIEEDNKVFRANADFTSGATFDPDNWTLISPVRIDGDLAFLESDEIELRSQKLLLDGNGNTDDTGRADNLFPDPRFYKRNNQGTCTGCSFLDFSGVADADVFIGDNALGVFFTTETGEAVFDFPVRESQQGKQGILDLQIKVKQGGDYKLDITRGTNVIETLDISASADGYLRYSYYFVLGTSVGFNIRNTESVAAGDTVIIDDVYLGASRLPILPTKSCTDELDCVNEFSARVSNTGVVNDKNADWIESIAITDSSIFTITFKSGVFSVPPRCNVTAIEPAESTQEARIYTEATPSSIAIRTYGASSATTFFKTPHSFHIECSKLGDDYKPITQQGVITRENEDAFKTQTKTLSANVTTTGVMSDLTFTDLDVGASYMVIFNAYASSIDGTLAQKRARVDIFNGATSLARWSSRVFTAEGAWDYAATVSKSFEATSSTLTFDITGLVNARILAADSFAQLIKLPNTVNLKAEIANKVSTVTSNYTFPVEGEMYTLSVDAATAEITLPAGSRIGTKRLVRKIHSTQGSIDIKTSGSEKVTRAELSEVNLNADGDYWLLEKVSNNRWELVDGVESGSNANGEYWRQADGRMFCTYKKSIGDTDVTSEGSYRFDWDYPAPFIASASVTYNLLTNSTGDFGLFSRLVKSTGRYGSSNGVTNSSTNIIVGFSGATSQAFRIRWEAKGRWYE